MESAGMAQSSKTTHSLRILQWNADGLSPTKTIELGHRLSEDRIDICLVQETKWKITKSTPRLTGFTSVRLDRKNQNGGGGLVTYVKSSLVFELLQQASISGTEIMTLRVKLGKKRWAKITNLYCPPSRIHTAQSTLALPVLPNSPDCLILGDLNAHHKMWDEFQPVDTRCERKP